MRYKNPTPNPLPASDEGAKMYLIRAETAVNGDGDSNFQNLYNFRNYSASKSTTPTDLKPTQIGLEDLKI
jgi:hypothetical protein